MGVVQKDKKMKLLFNIAFVAICISAGDQQCMDWCGANADECFDSCNPVEENCFDNEQYCHYMMCRCFANCGCRECCEYMWEKFDDPPLLSEKSFEDQIQSKQDVSQFLKTK